MDIKKRIVMVRIFLFFLGITGMFFPVVLAQDNRSGDTGGLLDSKADIGMETIVITLNKTLEENKKLQSETEKLQMQFQKLAMENNVLKAQIIELNEGRYRLRDEERKLRKDAEQKASDLERVIGELKQEKEVFLRVSDETEKKIAAVSAENKKLKELISVMSPEGEKTAYDKLVEHLGEGNEPMGSSGDGGEKVSKQVEVELGALYYSLGNMLLEEGDYKGAEGKYKKALELNPKDSWAHYNLGVLFDFYLNNDPEAVVHYKEYLRLAPDAEDANKIRERLSEMDLMTYVIPAQPIKKDFDEHIRRFQ